MKKQVKVDPETRSYDILTKTHQNIPIIPNMAKVGTTLGNEMNIGKLEKYSKHLETGRRSCVF